MHNPARTRARQGGIAPETRKQKWSGDNAKTVSGARYRYGRRIQEREDWDKAADETLKRFLVDWCESWRDCGYRSCFRAGRCRRHGVPCFDRDVDRTCATLLTSRPLADLCEIAPEIEDEFDAEE